MLFLRAKRIPQVVNGQLVLCPIAASRGLAASPAALARRRLRLNLRVLGNNPSTRPVSICARALCLV